MLWLVVPEWLPDVHPGPLFTQTSHQVASVNFRYLPQSEPVTLSSLCSVCFFLLIKKKKDRTPEGVIHYLFYRRDESHASSV